MNIKKILICSVLSVFVFSTSAFAAFSDVSDDTYYKSSIDWMAENGVINGYGDGTFGPDNCVKRAELLKMVYLTLEADLDDLTAGSSLLSDRFSDVDSSAWYWPYLRYALLGSTVQGYSDGTFRPGQCVSRMESIKIATLEFNDGEVPGAYGLYAKPYDIATTENLLDQWWWSYFESAISSGSIGLAHFESYDADWEGTSGSGVCCTHNPTYDFGPNDSMTRQEVAEMLYRMKAMKDNDTLSFYDNPAPIAPNSIVSSDEADYLAAFSKYVCEYHKLGYDLDESVPTAEEEPSVKALGVGIYESYGFPGSDDDAMEDLSDNYSEASGLILLTSSWKDSCTGYTECTTATGAYGVLVSNDICYAPGEVKEDTDCVVSPTGGCEDIGYVSDAECRTATNAYGFLMSDELCYAPGENVVDTDCIVASTGGCESLE